MSGTNGNGYWLKRFIGGILALLVVGYGAIGHLYRTKADADELAAVKAEVAANRTEYIYRVDEIKALMMCLHYPELPGCGKVLDQARKDEMPHPQIVR